ncbi:MAG: hypothetical protein CSA84_05175 [Actinomycetales bacterium]|nr:MAG: hypothetical protein CSA84_05175 [Actinomycetales bacterium]
MTVRPRSRRTTGLPGGPGAGRRPRASGIALVLFGALLAGLLGACSGSGAPSTAAVVNGEVITVSEVQQATQQLRRVQGPRGTPILNTETETLGMLILAAVINEPIARERLWVPDARYNSLIGQVPEPTEATRQVLLAASAKLTDASIAQFKQQLAAADVEVNPRFGSFDGTAITLEHVVPDWIRPQAETGEAQTPSAT